MSGVDASGPNDASIRAATSRLSGAGREQMAWMRDGPVLWSVTHQWPSHRDALESAGLVRALPKTPIDGFLHPTTEITELGRAVRAALSKARGEPTPSEGEG